MPAPLSPLTKMDWLPCSFIIALASATAKRCGLSSPKAAPLYCSIMWTSYKCGNLRKGFTAIRIFPVLDVTHVYLIEGKPRSKIVKHSRLMEVHIGPIGSV